MSGALGARAFSHLRRRDIAPEGVGLVVRSDAAHDWVREITLQRLPGTVIVVAARYNPGPPHDADAAASDELVFKALCRTFGDVRSLLGKLPAPTDAMGAPPGAFLRAIKHGGLALPDPAHFCLASGWHLTKRRQQRHWVHAYLPRPTLYGARAYERFLAVIRTLSQTPARPRQTSSRGAISGP